MGDSYDDKLETMLVTRQRVAEKKRASRQQELQKKIAIGIVVLSVLILFIVLVSKGCSNGGTNTDKVKESTSSQPTFVSDVTTPPEETTTISGFVNMYTLDVLNFRAEASTDAEILLQIPAGEKVKVLSNEGEWVRIKYSGKKGYVMLEYLSETDPDEESTEAGGTEATEEATEEPTAEEPTSE